MLKLSSGKMMAGGKKVVPTMEVAEEEGKGLIIILTIAINAQDKFNGLVHAVCQVSLSSLYNL